MLGIPDLRAPCVQIRIFWKLYRVFPPLYTPQGLQDERSRLDRTLDRTIAYVLHLLP